MLGLGIGEHQVEIILDLARDRCIAGCNVRAHPHVVDIELSDLEAFD